MAPIVLERVEDDRIPREASKINYLFFDGAEDFEVQADTLARALQTDIKWVKEHTRLGELARRWDERGCPGPLLLGGQELADAERWLASRPREAPVPTDLCRRYLKAGRARQRQATLFWGIGLVAVTGLAFYAVEQKRAADQQNAEFQREQKAKQDAVQAQQREQKLREEAEFTAAALKAEEQRKDEEAKVAAALRAEEQHKEEEAKAIAERERQRDEELRQEKERLAKEAAAAEAAKKKQQQPQEEKPLHKAHRSIKSPVKEHVSPAKEHAQAPSTASIPYLH